MLKKISHIFLSVLLLTTTIGMAVSRHYCGRTFISLKLFGEAKSCCEDAVCCHNENHFFKIKDDFSKEQIPNVPQLAEIDILCFNSGLSEIVNEAENNSYIILFNDLPPPPKIQKTLSLRQSYLL